MIRSHLGFIVDFFFLVPEEGRARSSEVRARSSPPSLNARILSLKQIHRCLAACGVLQNYYLNNIIIYYSIIMLYYMTISRISQQREREQVGHTQELITKIIMHVKHSTYEKTP
jgi:hypothetical protein